MSFQENVVSKDGSQFMSNNPSLNAKQVRKILIAIGYRHERTKGSHEIYSKQGCKLKITVPFHGSQDLKKGTLKSIIDSTGLSKDEFFSHLD